MQALSSLLVGKPAVQAALESGNRDIYRLFLSETLPLKRRAPFLQSAQEKNIPVEELSAPALTERTGVENHGGVAAEVGPRRFCTPEELINFLSALPHTPLVFALENLHEAHNLGYALRCVEALGADAVLLSPWNWGEGEVIVAQSSSGAFDRMKIAPLQEPRTLFKRLEEIGIESVSATAGAIRNFYDFDLRAPVLIAVGGEFKGLSDEVKKACRHSAHLPMNDAIPSFPAGHAAAILASEAARQRRLGGTPGPLWPKIKPKENSPSNSRRGRLTW